MVEATSNIEIDAAIVGHMPAIRNSLVLLFCRRIDDDLLPHEGGEPIRAALEPQTGSPGVDDPYFPSRVMQ
jgi:flagellar basal body-associated protein FliL